VKREIVGLTTAGYGRVEAARRSSEIVPYTAPSGVGMPAALAATPSDALSNSSVDSNPSASNA
jgi:hypothetical protein